MGLESGKRYIWEGQQRRVRGLHSLSIGQSQGDAVLGGEFVGAAFFRANGVARASIV